MFQLMSSNYIKFKNYKRLKMFTLKLKSAAVKKKVEYLQLF